MEIIALHGISRIFGARNSRRTRCSQCSKFVKKAQGPKFRNQCLLISRALMVHILNSVGKFFIQSKRARATCAFIMQGCCCGKCFVFSLFLEGGTCANVRQLRPLLFFNKTTVMTLPNVKLDFKFQVQEPGLDCRTNGLLYFWTHFLRRRQRLYQD